MLISLPVVWIIIIDFVGWFIIHMSVAYGITRLPKRYINTSAWLYRQRSWEKRGRIYEKLFQIKRWKGLLPDGAALFKQGFRKKQLASPTREYLQEFILEMCRAELVHWLVILFAPVFFIWNWWWAGIIMIVYALLANMPCIIAQRYNRVRFRRLLARMPEA